MESRLCLYCQTPFAPNKYSKRQKVCSNPDCQKRRQLESMRAWRQTHPQYFKYDESKGPEWLQNQRRRAKTWRDNNKDKIRSYRQSHIEEYRNYMREYMRKYREKMKNVGSDSKGP